MQVRGPQLVAMQSLLNHLGKARSGQVECIMHYWGHGFSRWALQERRKRGRHPMESGELSNTLRCRNHGRAGHLVAAVGRSGRRGWRCGRRHRQASAVVAVVVISAVAMAVVRGRERKNGSGRWKCRYLELCFNGIDSPRSEGHVGPNYGKTCGKSLKIKVAPKILEGPA